MNGPRPASQAEWLAARKSLLAEEKEFTRWRDGLRAKRRELPMVKIEKEYFFEAPDARASLRGSLRRSQSTHHLSLHVRSGWDEGCKSCSHCADNFAGAVVHLAARDTSPAGVSRAPIGKIERFKKRMGWTFRWVSSSGNDFNYDFHVTLDEAAGSVEYNYANAAALLKDGKLWTTDGELPGLSVFLRDGESIYHTYSTYQRGLDLLLNTYNYLDLTPPLRRQEEGDRTQGWIRHHDRYGA